MSEIPAGLCQCGCGQRTNVPKKSNTTTGAIRGVPRQFIQGHHNRSGAESSGWKGGRRISADGYVLVYAPEHPRAVKRVMREHILVAEKALGKHLPPGAPVHHVNGDKTDNRPGNLVICPDNAYHQLLHLRAAALAACGHADWRRCYFCGEWDAPENVRLRSRTAYHRACDAEYHRKRRAERRAHDATLLLRFGGK